MPQTVHRHFECMEKYGTSNEEIYCVLSITVVKVEPRTLTGDKHIQRTLPRGKAQGVSAVGWRKCDSATVQG